MGREIVTLQIGQCGNQIGCKLWDLALCEHLSGPRAGYDDAMSTFFERTAASRDGPVALDDFRARAVLVDTEEGVVNHVRRGPLGRLFEDWQYVSAASGAGNNWCVCAWVRSWPARRLCRPSRPPPPAHARQGARLRRVRGKVARWNHGLGQEAAGAVLQSAVVLHAALAGRGHGYGPPQAAHRRI